LAARAFVATEAQRMTGGPTVATDALAATATLASTGTALVTEAALLPAAPGPPQATRSTAGTRCARSCVGAGLSTKGEVALLAAHAFVAIEARRMIGGPLVATDALAATATLASTGAAVVTEAALVGVAPRPPQATHPPAVTSVTARTLCGGSCVGAELSTKGGGALLAANPFVATEAQRMPRGPLAAADVLAATTTLASTGTAFVTEAALVAAVTHLPAGTAPPTATLQRGDRTSPSDPSKASYKTFPIAWSPASSRWTPSALNSEGRDSALPPSSANAFTTFTSRRSAIWGMSLGSASFITDCCMSMARSLYSGGGITSSTMGGTFPWPFVRRPRTSASSSCTKVGSCQTTRFESFVPRQIIATSGAQARTCWYCGMSA